MKKLGMVLAAACATALCFVLIGCNNGGNQDFAKNFVGNYELVGMVQNGTEANADDIARMKALGLEVKLEMKSDNTFTLDLFGEMRSGAWKAKSASECEITLDNQPVPCTLDGDKLTLAQNNNELTFQRAES